MRCAKVASNLLPLDQQPDPRTPLDMLPVHMRGTDNSREERCRRTALRHATELLSLKQRQALHMRYDLGMSFRSISEELGISRSAAAKRIKRSLEILHSLIELCLLVQREVGPDDES